ncbi:heterokaryon incompatibility protein-domain-containing protein [Aspergillus ambiguus]|uniref:HET domain-containing protein n=1 Tax=Aspergillus ambiguus TaxID=176160 RepID=UPI003CCDDBE4
MSTTAKQMSGTCELIHPVYNECEIDKTKDEIRLLKVYPGAGNEVIQCELLKASLGADPIYSALSYVWGAQTKKERILVNGRNISVTTNLYQALRRIRARSRDTPTIIWADAICINQSQPVERNHQVGLMGKIYSNCQEVLVWLGEMPSANFDERCCVFSGDDSDFDEKWDDYLACFEFDSTGERNLGTVSHCSCHKSTIDTARQCAWFFRLLAEGRYFSELPPICFRQGKRSAYPNVFNSGMKWLSSNPWFRRLWIIQEAALAPSVTVLFDSVSLPHDLLTRAKEALNTQHLPAPDVGSPASHLINPAWFLNFFSPIQSLRDSRSAGKRISLLKLCLDFNEARATEDLDRIFGLLGLVSEWYGAEPMAPDYNNSAERVYSQVSGQYIATTNSLLPLAFSSSRGKYPDLPSWAVDWTVSGPQSPSTRTAWHDILPLFNACGSLPRKVSVQQHTHLSTLGVEVDCISDVGHTNDAGLVKKATYQNWRNLVLPLISLYKLYPSGCHWKDAWWRTLCTDCCWTDHSALRASSQNIDGLARLITTQVLGSLPSDDSILGPRPSDSNPTRDDANMLTTCSIFHNNRKLFITRKGYIGLGNENSMTGDKVFVLPGLQIPLLLRREDNIGSKEGFSSHDGVYRVVGECYVHGIMDGEAAKNMNRVERLISIV